MVDEVAPYKPLIRANFLEPLLNENIADIADYVTSRDLDFHIISNGYHLPQRAEGLVEAGTRTIRISLDGPAAVHNEIRGLGDSFDRAMEGIGKVLEKKRKLGDSNTLVGVCLTISGQNFDRIVDFSTT